MARLRRQDGELVKINYRLLEKLTEARFRSFLCVRFSSCYYATFSGMCKANNIDPALALAYLVPLTCCSHGFCVLSFEVHQHAGNRNERIAIMQLQYETDQNDPFKFEALFH